MMLARRLVGTHEIAEMFGVSRQRAQQIVTRKDFPRPYDVLHMGKIWRRTAVEGWAKEHGRGIAGSDPPGPGHHPDSPSSDSRPTS